VRVVRGVYCCHMAHWRVWIVAVAALVLAFWAGAIAQRQSERAAHSISALHQRVAGEFFCDHVKSGWQDSATHQTFPSRSDCFASVGSVYTLRDRMDEWLRYLGVSLVVLGVAATPWFLDRRRPSNGLPVAS